MIVLIDMLNTTKKLGMVSKINRGDCIRRFIGLYMVLALVLAFVIPVRMVRVCQNRHILLFVFLQARRGKILSMPLF